MDKIQVIRRTALILGIMLVVGIFVRCAIRWSEVAAVQNSLQRNWEINFNSGGRPRFLPAFADNLAADALMKIYKADVGGRNRGSVYRDRFQSLFRGPIRNLEIYGPDVFDEHLATAISRFGQLEHFGLRDDSGNGSTEEAWESLLQSAARLPKLTELEISGGLLTSRALRKLDGASKLKKLTVEGALDGTCLDGIANLRKGPGTSYKQLGTLSRGQSVAVIGQNKGSTGFTWYKLVDGSWVREDAVHLEGTCQDIPKAQP